jgi:hypothetical protein
MAAPPVLVAMALAVTGREPPGMGKEGFENRRGWVRACACMHAKRYQ